MNQRQMVGEADDKVPPKCRKCAGLLYFSSHARKPLCFGLSRLEPNAKHYTGGKFKSDPRALLDFKYACVGYSIHDNAKASHSTSGADEHSELPFCMGIEILAERRRATQGQNHRHIKNIEDHKTKEVTPITKIPSSATPNSSPTGIRASEEFAARFIRNAGLVAGAVVKNLSRVGNSIKTAAMDIFHSDRGRPK